MKLLKNNSQRVTFQLKLGGDVNIVNKYNSDVIIKFVTLKNNVPRGCNTFLLEAYL